MDALSPNYYVISGTSYFALRFDGKGLNTVGHGHVDEEGQTIVDRVTNLCGTPPLPEPLLNR